MTLAADSGEPGRPHPRITPVRQRIHTPRPLVIAHRGDSRVAPENTLAAFRQALSTGADMVELDYWHSSDGVPIVIHDETLDRTTNVRSQECGENVLVSSKTAAQLSQLDAGSWFHARFADERPPLLALALEVIQPTSTTVIERKGGDAQTLIDLLKTQGAIDKVVVQSFDWRFLADCRRLAPDIVLGALGEDDLHEEQLQSAHQFRADFFGWCWQDISGADIDRIHRAGFRAWVYTVDEPADAERLMHWGIDGLITNEPAKMAKLVAQSRRSQPTRPGRD